MTLTLSAIILFINLHKVLMTFGTMTNYMTTEKVDKMCTDFKTMHAKEQCTNFMRTYIITAVETSNCGKSAELHDLRAEHIQTCPSYIDWPARSVLFNNYNKYRFVLTNFDFSGEKSLLFRRKQQTFSKIIDQCSQLSLSLKFLNIVYRID